jgi:hypothetical protein
LPLPELHPPHYLVFKEIGFTGVALVTVALYSDLSPQPQYISVWEYLLRRVVGQVPKVKLIGFFISQGNHGF